MIENLKLGKKAARHGAVKLKLIDFVDLSALPKPPASFGHEQLFKPSEWGMLGNDKYGCCVFSGAAHETMLWNLECGKRVIFDDASVLSDYSAVTGFDACNPNTDQGTDMQAAASYRLKTGIKDSTGLRHQIGAYLAIAPGNLQEHYIASYLFHAMGIGIQVSDVAMDQFRKGKPWTVVKNSRNEGGHYIPIVGKRLNNINSVSWGRIQPMSVDFFTKNNDESVAYVSLEMLVNNKSSEEFDSEGLIKILNQLK